MFLSAISHPSTPIGQNWHAQLLRFKHRHRLLTGGSVSRDHASVPDPSRDCPELVPMEEASALLLSVRFRPRDNSQLLNPIIS
jgi:hypothetical protein